MPENPAEYRSSLPRRRGFCPMSRLRGNAHLQGEGGVPMPPQRHDALPAALAADRPADAVILCDWLPPDFGAVGQYTLARARERARMGQRVVLIGLSSQ